MSMPAGGDVRKSRIGDGARLSSAPCVMRPDIATSLSDADGVGRRAGVTVTVPLPAPPGTAPGPREAAASDGRGDPPAPEPSLGLASHVNLKRLVGGLLQYCERGGGNPAVVGLEQGTQY